jgi:glycosyltransferase involved in cell wall biosynthesis
VPGRLPQVVFITDIVTPYMVAVLEALAKRVHLTAVFCARAGSRGAGWAFDEPFPFRFRLLDGPAVRLRGRDAADIYPNPKILRVLIAERPAAVISGAFSLPTILAAAYARLTGARLIIHSDGTAYSERGLGWGQLLARHALLREATACVGNSQPAVQRFVGLGALPDRVFHAPHTTNIAPLHAVARKRFASPDPDARTAVVLHVGRLIPRKGITRLLQAMARATPHASLRLVLVGDGSDGPRLRRLAQELGITRDVEFRGFVDQPALPEVYAEADIFAFPTLSDPFGIALLEAAGAGLPLVASPFGGATLELIEDGRNGFIREPDDIVGWSDALVALARDPHLRRMLGTRAHEATLDRTPDAAAARYADAVHAALEWPRNSTRAPTARRRRLLVG